MKVLYHFRTQGTGAEGVHIAGVAEAFARLGHAVTFSNPTGVDPRNTAGASPFATPKRRGWLGRLAAHAPALVFELLEIGYNFVCHWRLRGLLSREPFDLVYERHAFFLCATALLSSRHGIPLVVEVNELAGDERIRAKPWLAPLARFADRITFRRAWRIVVVSPHLRRRISGMGIPEERILVLPNAVSEEELTTPADGALVRERLGLMGMLVVGFVGWFVAWHRLDALLEQIAGLAPTQPRLRLLLVGDGPLKQELAAKAAALGVGDRVIFSGPVPHAEVGNHIAAMDVSVVPHSNEFRSPIKLFESMARGRPVVAPRTEPIASVIQHEMNGLLFDPATPSDLGAQLKRLLTDPALRQRLGNAARGTVEARHTWTQNVRAVLDGFPQAPNRRLPTH